MDFTESARKHGISEEDILHAIRHPLAHYEQSHEGERRLLILGPDSSGRFLEIVVLPAREPERVIHADILRPKFYGQLP
ncbi:MAG TPA: DUF4258 domain-containing protein [Pseudolysinimonas sp.]|nr:DUF4258 domain-containing protein [Pseudolysinimonas sp.]